MLIYFLFISLILLLIGCYIYFKKDIVEPAILFLIAYSFSVFCTLFNVEKWNVKLLPETFFILIFGAIEFVIVSIVIHKIFKKKIENDKETNLNETFINSKKITILIIIFIIYDLIILGLLIYNIVDIASRYGEFSNISDMLTIYKDATSYTTKARLPKYITILLKPFIASVYISYYLFLRKIFKRNNENNLKKHNIKEVLKNSFFLVPAIFYIVSVFFQSNREAIIILLFNFFVMSVIFWYKNNGWTKTIKASFLIKMIIVCILGLIMFFFSAKWVGRINNKNMFDYITFYCGGSIECLNQYVKEPTDIEIVRGEETFYNLIHTTDSLGITNYNLSSNMTVHREFRYYNGEMIGNVYTGYRRWLHDYGIIGIIVLQFIFATIVNVLYCSIKFTKNKTVLNDFLIILYSYLSYTIYLQPIDDYFYFDVIGQASFAVIFCLIALYLLACKVDNRIDFKKLKKRG